MRHVYFQFVNFHLQEVCLKPHQTQNFAMKSEGNEVAIIYQSSYMRTTQIQEDTHIDRTGNNTMLSNTETDAEIGSTIPTASQPIANIDVRTQIFSTKLAAILDEPRFSHIICWMPHGRAWRVLSPQKFIDEVAPQYFEYPNYHSFQRLVNAWGFRRIKNGRDVNAYYHEVSNL